MILSGVPALCLTALGAAGSAQLEFTVLSEYAVDFEVCDLRYMSLDSLRSMDNGEIMMYISRVYSGNEMALHPMGWAVELGEHVAYTYETGPGERPVLRFHMRPDEGFQNLTAMGESGDTLWSTPLVKTDEFDNNMLAYTLSAGDLFLVSHPDCWSTCSYTARVSSSGELLWDGWLETEYLLDLPENQSECKPRIHSVRETGNGDLLLCGSIEQWVTTPDYLFVTLLDGATGEPLWKSLHSGLGEARALDVANTSSGEIIVVGTTAETTHSETCPAASIWSDQLYPMVVVFDENGEELGSGIIEGTSLTAFHGVTQLVDESLFILGDSEESCVLIRIMVQ